MKRTPLRRTPLKRKPKKPKKYGELTFRNFSQKKDYVKALQKKAERLCVDCGKKLTGFYAKRCSSCVSKRKVGDRNSNWKGGKPKCIGCGKEITRGYHYCHSCAVKGEKGSNWKGGEKALTRYCKNCGKKLQKGANYRSKTGFCKSCWSGHKGNENPNWKGGYSVIPKYCIDCGKLLGNYQAKRCKSCAVKLHLHHNWQGGKSFEPYPLGWTKTHKEQIRNRDGYKCQLCGKPEIENNRRLDIHHKDYTKENIKPENLISLCKSCHTKTNYNRNYWIDYFKEKTNEKKEIAAQEAKG